MKKLIPLLLIICSFQVEAQLWNQNQKVVASDRSVRDYFGESVHLNADRAIVGASATNGNINENFVGSAYILDKDANGLWNETQILYASDAKSGDNFGNDVIIDGNYAYVAAITEGSTINSYDGAVYVFELNINGVWSEIQKITPTDRTLYNNFGKSIKVEGNTLVIGANYTFGTGGAVLIFEKDANDIWNEIQIIQSLDAESYDEFGSSVSIDGQYILIGTPKEDSQLTDNSGAAYIFKKNNLGIWEEQQKLIPNTRHINSYFGYNVAIKGDFAFISAPYESDFDNSLFEFGAVYIFKKGANNVWTEHQKLLASDLYNNDRFGNEIDINEGNLIIGAYNKSVYTNGTTYYNEAGSVYFFKKDNAGYWNELEDLTPSPRHNFARFGNSLSMNNNEVLIGAYFEDRNENNLNSIQDAGACYFFESSTLNLSEYNLANITLFPNPTTDFIYLTNMKNKENYKIYNMVGSLIMEGQINNKINVQNLNSGVYLLNIKNTTINFIKK